MVRTLLYMQNLKETCAFLTTERKGKGLEWGALTSLKSLVISSKNFNYDAPVNGMKMLT